MCSVKVFDYKLNADLNKKLFDLDLKIAKEGLSRITKDKLFVRYEIPECLFMFYFLCFLDDCCNFHNLLLFMLDIV